jgi:putative membrane protein
VNALMLWIVGKLVPGFYVDGFWTAFFGSIVVSIVSWMLNAVFGGSETQQHISVRRTETVDGIKRVEGRVIDSEHRA